MELFNNNKPKEEEKCTFWIPFLGKQNGKKKNKGRFPISQLGFPTQ